MKTIYNTHIHLFNGKCAPKDFIQVGTKFKDPIAVRITNFLLSPFGSTSIGSLSTFPKKKKIEFLKLGVSITQKEVFEQIKSVYDNSKYYQIRFVPLTIDMDYMTDPANAPVQNYLAQIAEITELKKKYPSTIFPFLGIDPRNPNLRNLDWFKDKFLTKTFSGIKIYPANGFFPFDPRLDGLYSFAESEGIPIMTHCTRTGSFFIGDNVLNILDDKPASLNEDNDLMLPIYNRIALYKKHYANSKNKNNEICNVFSHPLNYRPVLKKYPKLKLCLAHLGGVGEILGHDNTEKKSKKFHLEMTALEKGTNTWYQIITNEIFNEFPNVYSDISYSLCDKNAMIKVKRDMDSGIIPINRILFGTDFYMNIQEGNEIEMVYASENIFGEYFSAMMSENIERYLFE